MNSIVTLQNELYNRSLSPETTPLDNNDRPLVIHHMYPGAKVQSLSAFARALYLVDKYRDHYYKYLTTHNLKASQSFRRHFINEFMKANPLRSITLHHNAVGGADIAGSLLQIENALFDIVETRLLSFPPVYQPTAGNLRASTWSSATMHQSAPQNDDFSNAYAFLSTVNDNVKTIESKLSKSAPEAKGSTLPKKETLVSDVENVLTRLKTDPRKNSLRVFKVSPTKDSDYDYSLCCELNNRGKFYCHLHMNDDAETWIPGGAWAKYDMGRRLLFTEGSEWKDTVKAIIENYEAKRPNDLLTTPDFIANLVTHLNTAKSTDKSNARRLKERYTYSTNYKIPEYTVGRWPVYIDFYRTGHFANLMVGNLTIYASELVYQRNIEFDEGYKLKDIEGALKSIPNYDAVVSQFQSTYITQLIQAFKDINNRKKSSKKPSNMEQAVREWKMDDNADSKGRWRIYYWGKDPTDNKFKWLEAVQVQFSKKNWIVKALYYRNARHKLLIPAKYQKDLSDQMGARFNYW